MMWKKIKVQRSDNGGEYMDKDFTDFYTKECIKRDWTTPYNPQQNGVTERKNRTIVGASKAMLYDRICLDFYGQRHVTQRCTFKTGHLIEH